MAIRKSKIIKDILEQLEEENGFVTPKDLLEVARPKESPIHNLFDWNDRTAGEKFRLWQARHIITNVQVTITEKQTSGYWNTTVKVDDVKVRGYFSTKKVLSSKKLLEAVLQDAVEEIEHWTEKFQNLKELSGVVNKKRLKEVKEKVATN